MCLQIDALTGEEVSRPDFLRTSEVLAQNLLNHGCRRGDVVGIFSPNSVEWLTVVAATYRIHAIPAGLNFLLTSGLVVTYCLKYFKQTLPKLMFVFVFVS